MDFFFFLLLTAVMLLRPEELSMELNGAQLYLWTILITTLISLPKLRGVFDSHEMTRRSIAFCILGYFASLTISALLSGNWNATGQDYCLDFFKVALYYFLLIAILDTPERLHNFLGVLVLLACGVATVAVLHYYDVFEFPLLPPNLVEKRMNLETGEETETQRALASGIFGDPNDLCLILALGILCCVYRAFSTRAPSARIFWLLPVPALFYVLSLTGSRGGLLGLLAGFAALMYAIYGLKVGIPLIALGIFGLLTTAGGRSADITGGGTARERLTLWAEGISALQRQPASLPFGLGPGWYLEEQTLLAHNSFINTYVEFGVIGGGFFLIAFYTALRLIARPAVRPEWARIMRPAMLGIVAAYAAGCFSLSRHLVLPTYLVLGLATAYINLSGEPPSEHQVTSRWFRWVLPTMVLGLVALKVITVLLGMGV